MSAKRGKRILGNVLLYTPVHLFGGLFARETNNQGYTPPAERKENVNSNSSICSSITGSSCRCSNKK